MKLGARIVKTGVAVALAIYVSRLIGIDSAVYAAVAAVLMVQPSLYRSWRNFIEQLQANLVGVGLAVAAVQLLGNHPVVVGLVVALTIIVNLRLKFEKAVGLAIVAAIAVTEGIADPGYWQFVGERFLLILIGMLSALVVNVSFAPPKYEGKLLSQLKETRDHMSLLLRNTVSQEIQRFPAEKKKAQDLLNKAEEYYLRFEEEQSYASRSKRSHGVRQLVLFKRMMDVMRKEMDVIRALDAHRAAVAQADAVLLDTMQAHIADLTAYHQKILGKYEGTIKTTPDPHERSKKVFSGHERLVRQLIALYDPKTQEETWIHLFPVVAALSDLATLLDHLDKLVEVYATYHRHT